MEDKENVGIFDENIDTLEEENKQVDKEKVRDFKGTDTFSFKMKFLDTLNEYVYPYIYEKGMMLYDKQNPIYQEWVQLFSKAGDIVHKAPSAEVYQEMSDLYTRLMNLIEEVDKAKKNEQSTGGRV